MKYSVVMYNFNDYEIMRHIPRHAQNPEIEFLYITDNPQYVGGGWKTIVDETLSQLSPFDKCYAVRFNLFKYATSDVCLYLDGSIQIISDLMPLFLQFDESKKDIGVMVHPYRSTMIDEYIKWTIDRHYDKKQGFKCLAYMHNAGYDCKNYHGLYQGCLRFIRKTERNAQLDKSTLETLKTLGTNGIIERLDQTIFSFLLNTTFSDMSIYPISEWIIHSAFLQWMVHATNTPIPPPPHQLSGYCRNHITNLHYAF